MKTSRTNPAPIPSSERGSALIVVVMLCAFTLVLVGSYLYSLSAQSKVNYRATLQNEARNAAEGMAEYALAELNRRADSNPSFGVGTNPNPLSGYTLPTSDLNFIAPGSGNSHVVASEVGFKNSVLSNAPSGPMLIDPADPVNSQDSDVGKILSVRSVNIFGKAAVRDPSTRQLITSYVAQNVQIREQAWFNYAIFYNMDLEFHAGPNFTVLGPVHTNADVYLTEGGGNKLKFFSTLTAVNKIYRYDKYTGNIGSHNGTVQCISAAGMNAADLKTMAANEDSNNGNFYTVAKTKWNSFVQDKTFSVLKFNPPGLPAYVPEDFTTSSATELRNNAYLMIEPQLSSLSTDTDYGQKGLASENLKFSALSSFVIQVSPPTAPGEQPKWKLVVYQATDPTHALSANNHPARSAIDGKPIIDLTIDPFNDVDDDAAPLSGAVIKHALKAALLDAIVSVPYRDSGASGWGTGSASATLKAFNAAPPATTTINYYPIYDRREGYNYPGGTSSPTRGLYGAMNALIVDLGKLNTLLNDTTGIWLKPYGSTDYVYNPAATYTGVVYVQFPLASIDTSRFPSPLGSTADGDMIRPAQAPTATAPGYAVVTKNGSVVPQLAGGSPDGFTIATNGPLYVWGNFNADGNSATGSSTTPDSTSEVPALIAADAVTILSAKSNFSFATMSQGKGTAATFTEVSAAIVAGLVPTQPGHDDIWAGGVHNLVRYLESWGGKNYRYRGSIAVLYESEVAKSPYQEGYGGYYYGPPTRDLGYHQYLAQGRFPPATPIKRTVRRMNLQDFYDASAYAAGPTTPPAAN